jgi:hypothetical protein
MMVRILTMDHVHHPHGDPRRSPTKKTVNPYQSTIAPSSIATTKDARNPAKTLLILIGALYAGFAPLAFLTGLQAGLHLMAAAAVMFVLGGGTIWLALREFTTSFRIVTIIWGICLTVFFAFAAFSAFDPSDVGGVIFYGVMLLVTAPIPILAIRTAPHLVVDGDTSSTTN